MKRFYSFILLFTTLLACVFFSACGNSYKNLKMSFIDENNELITETNLILDDNDLAEENLKNSENLKMLAVFKFIALRAWQTFQIAK